MKKYSLEEMWTHMEEGMTDAGNAAIASVADERERRKAMLVNGKIIKMERKQPVKYKVELTEDGWHIFERHGNEWHSWGVGFPTVWDAHLTLFSIVRSLEL